MPATTIDLNADLGEECADDEALLQIVTTANVAAGGHAGGGDVLLRTVTAAALQGVAVGAHPSYVDREGFGRTSLLHRHDDASLTALVRDQALAVASACADRGMTMSHVKAHGAMYHDIGADERAAAAFVEAVGDVSAESGSELAVMGAARSALHRACQSAGLPYICEAFADRASLPDGRLAPRSARGGVLHDGDAVVRQALALAADGSVVATDGTVIAVEADTLCVHGDTPDSVRLASRVRSALEEHGITITHPSRP